MKRMDSNRKDDSPMCLNFEGTLSFLSTCMVKSILAKPNLMS